MQGRYNIDKSFGIFAKFSPPLGRFVLWLARIFLTIMPKGLHGKGIKAKRVFVPAEGGRRVRAYLIGPAKGEGAAPCIVYYHGGKVGETIWHERIWHTKKYRQTQRGGSDRTARFR